MPNQNLIDVFDQLIQQTQLKIQDLKDANESKSKITSLNFKSKNFNKVFKILKAYPEEIVSVEQLKGIKGIGPGILKRIAEIIETGTLSTLVKKSRKRESKMKIISDLQRVSGIGPAYSKKLYDMGVTLDILLNNNASFYPELSHHQELGVRYFHDTEKRIPRSEIDIINEYLDYLISSLDPKYTFMICGSYRRGCPNSGDIDMLLKHEDIKTDKESKKTQVEYLQNVVEVLTNNDFIIDNLTESGRTKYMGYCRLEDHLPVRRIDIRFVSCESFHPAVLYFTGSGEFNKQMRLKALKKGYTLNEYGIYEIDSKYGKKIMKGDRVNVSSEKDIFDVLEMKYVKPTDRNI